MKHLIIFCVVLYSFNICSFAQQQSLQLAQNNKNKLIKEWSIVKYETFGVQTPPDSSQLNDKLILKQDMTFLLVERGKNITGKWSIQGEWMFLHVISPQKETRNFKIISVEEKEAIVEYKDADLVKTKYFLKALK